MTTYEDLLIEADGHNLITREKPLRAESHGRIMAYNSLIGLMGIIDSYNNHCQSLSETAEYFDVTEDFLIDALSYYKSKYGISVTIDNYVIYFEPSLGVLELV